MSTPKKGGLVCVTGAAGYIASHLVKQLLERGYRVRGTVRDAKSAKNNFLRDLAGAKERLELVDADLLGPSGTFDAAVKDCVFVFHTASPYILTVNDPQKELVDPALSGTKSVLESCLKAQNTIEKVVITSSMAAVTDSPDPNKVYSEADWNEQSSLKRNPYYYSKVVAEKFAYSFEQEKKPKWTVATINPSLVFGPALNDVINESVGSVPQGILAGTYPVILDLAWSCVDVRDVALAHILVAETKAAKGRHVCASETIHLRDLAPLVKKHFPKAAVPTFDMSGSIGSAVGYLMSYTFTGGKRDFLQTNLGKAARYDNSKMKSLGLNFMTVEKSVVDTINDLIAKKLVADVR